MPITTPNPSPLSLINQIVTLLNTNMTDPGTVLGTGEYVKDNFVTAAALRRNVDKRIKGIYVQYRGLDELYSGDNDEFFNLVVHKINLRVFRQYVGDDTDDELNARNALLRDIWEIAAIIRSNSGLGDNDDLEMKPITMPEDISSESDDALGTYLVAAIEITIEVRVFAGGCT